jgi:hypothetical protein
MQRTGVSVLLGAAAGAIVGLVIGFIWMALAPNNGFGDLAAAAVMTVFLIPGGLIIGGGLGYWRSRRGFPSVQP